MSFKDKYSNRIIGKFLDQAIIDGHFKPPNFWINNLLTYPKKSLNSFLKLNKMRLDELTTKLSLLYPDNYAHLIFADKDNKEPLHNLFGCNYTMTDIDIVVKVNKIAKLHPNEIDFLETYLINKYGLNIDVNLVSEINGSIQTMKGGNEIVNMVLETYDLHKNIHKCIFNKSQWVDITVIEKLKSLSKFVVDNGKEILGDTYLKFRQKKIDVYQNGIDRLKLAMEWLKIYSKTEIGDKNISFWKSTIMKITQTYLISKNIKNEIYSKLELAEKFSSFFPEYKELTRSLLIKKFRGFIDHEYLNLITKLILNLAKKEFPQYSEQINYLEIKTNPTSLKDIVFFEYIKSPLVPSEQFIKKWTDHCISESINKNFCSKNLNIDKLNIFPDLYLRILDVEQRSDEWVHLYKNVYVCGRSSGIKKLDENISPENKIRELFNLVSGCAGEDIVIDSFDFEKLYGDVTKITVGMIVEDLKVGSKGCNPDLLLLTKDSELIVVEIKTFQIYPSYNSDVMREAILARKQLEKTKCIINKKNIICKEGLIIYLFIFKDEEEYIRFDARYEKILFNIY
mgnify:CR=1 FL=1